jgi:hypothetical protein
MVPGAHTQLRPQYTYTRHMILAATAIMAMPSVDHSIHATKECEPFDTDSSSLIFAALAAYHTSKRTLLAN